MTNRLGGIAGVLGKNRFSKGETLLGVSPREFAAPLSQLSEGGQGGSLKTITKLNCGLCNFMSGTLPFRNECVNG